MYCCSCFILSFYPSLDFWQLLNILFFSVTIPFTLLHPVTYPAPLPTRLLFTWSRIKCSLCLQGSFTSISTSASNPSISEQDRNTLPCHSGSAYRTDLRWCRRSLMFFRITAFPLLFRRLRVTALRTAYTVIHRVNLFPKEAGKPYEAIHLTSLR